MAAAVLMGASDTRRGRDLIPGAHRSLATPGGTLKQPSPFGRLEIRLDARWSAACSMV